MTVRLISLLSLFCVPLHSALCPLSWRVWARVLFRTAPHPSKREHWTQASDYLCRFPASLKVSLTKFHSWSHSSSLNCTTAWRSSLRRDIGASSKWRDEWIRVRVTTDWTHDAKQSELQCNSQLFVRPCLSFVLSRLYYFYLFFFFKYSSDSQLEYTDTTNCSFLTLYTLLT